MFLIYLIYCTFAACKKIKVLWPQLDKLENTTGY